MNGEFRALSLGSLAAILIALGVWAVAWGPTETRHLEAAESNNLDGAVVRHALPFDTEGDDAEIIGTLGLVDGCLVLIGEDASFLVVWPASTTWAITAEEVVLANGFRIGLGEQVQGNGGYLEAASLDWLDASSQEHALTCPTNQWAAFNNRADAARPG